ncbi:hypothetical protein FRC07_009085 [Ceratobasidium sp. 392]|nr:hypothetical protein FRC07_009085 [Ceratobasidium sp. 392]
MSNQDANGHVEKKQKLSAASDANNIPVYRDNHELSSPPCQVLPSLSVAPTAIGEIEYWNAKPAAIAYFATMSWERWKLRQVAQLPLNWGPNFSVVLIMFYLKSHEEEAQYLMTLLYARLASFGIHVVKLAIVIQQKLDEQAAERIHHEKNAHEGTISFGGIIPDRNRAERR